MERLTGRRDGRTYIIGCPDFALPKIVGLIIQQAVDRLAAYEDTGLGPEEIDALPTLWMEKVKELSEIGPIDRLRELAQADREGRCVVLPLDDYTWTIRGDIVRGIIEANCRAAKKEAETALEGMKNG